jgi:CMP-N,N'-diacetyllegionaminic acid synthase
MADESTIVIIPARSGSKSIKNKNIQVVGSKSLLQHSIDFAKQLRDVDKILVSTDSPVYASIARKHGAWVPFMRPAEFSDDLSKDIAVMRHAVGWAFENLRMKIQTVIWIRPSYPFRNVNFVNGEFHSFIQKNNSCSSRSVRTASESPYKMWKMNTNQKLDRIVGDIDDDLHNSPRQILPKVHWQDGYVDFYRDCYINGTSCHHEILISGILTPEENLITDIDHKSDFEKINGTLDENSEHGFRKIEQIEGNEYSS